jgi:hypothetical protein
MSQFHDIESLLSGLIPADERLWHAEGLGDFDLG